MIDVNIILQVDGTVIAGVLILLTIRSITMEKENRKNAGFVAIPFALSAIVALLDAFNITAVTASGINILLMLSAVFAMSGFVYLVWFLKSITRTKNIESSNK